MLNVLLLLSLLGSVACVPAPTPTQPPLPRDVFSDIANGATSLLSQAESLPGNVGTVFESLGKSLPTQAAAGIIPGFDVPDSGAVQKKSGLDQTQIDALPAHILNIPGYANWTDNGWSLLFHGQAYKEVLTGDTLDEAAEGFIPDDKRPADLTPEEATQARNLTSAIYSLPVENVQLDFTLSLKGSEVLTFRHDPNTDSRGEFNGFVPLNKTAEGLKSKKDGVVQEIDVTLPFDTQLSNATSYLVPPEGVTIVSDIDDILRVTKIYEPEQGLNNTFVNKFIAWDIMPSIYSAWQKNIKGAHFHYLTTTPEPATRLYEEFIFGQYPGGSFDTRPYNFTTLDQIFAVREVALRRVMETFRQRKFILVGDTTNKDVMKLYPEIAKEFNGSVICILLRNTTATDSGNKFPYDTSHFEGLPKSSYFFFNEAADLKDLDVQNGDCVNKTIPQGVTFGWQNLPFNSESAASREKPLLGWLAGVLGMMLVLTW